MTKVRLSQKLTAGIVVHIICPLWYFLFSRYTFSGQYTNNHIHFWIFLKSYCTLFLSHNICTSIVQFYFELFICTILFFLSLNLFLLNIFVFIVLLYFPFGASVRSLNEHRKEKKWIIFSWCLVVKI